MLKAVSASKPRNKLAHNHAQETLSVSLHPVPAVTNIPFCCQTLRSFSPSPSTTALRANTRECLKGSEQPELLSLQGRQQLPAGTGAAPWWLEGGERPWAQAQRWSQRDLSAKRVGQVQGPACQSCSLLLLPGQLGWAAGTPQDLLEHSAIRLQARCGSRRVFHPRISGRWSFSTAWHPFTAGTTLLPHTHPSEGAELLPLLLVTATESSRQRALG